MAHSSGVTDFAPKRLVRAYVLPALLVAAALVLALQAPEAEQPSLFSVMLAAVAVAAYAGGWKSGMTAAFLSLLASDIFLLRPTWWSASHSSSYWSRLRTALMIDSRGDALRLCAFACTSFVICLLAALVEHKEQALRGAQQNFTDQQREIEFLKSTAKIWSWEFDLRSRRVTWTNMYSPVVMRREEPLESWLASIHAEDRERVKSALDRALVDGEFEAEYRVLVNDGEARRVMGRAVLYSLGGQIAGLRGIEIDRESRDAVPAGA